MGDGLVGTEAKAEKLGRGLFGFALMESESTSAVEIEGELERICGGEVGMAQAEPGLGRVRGGGRKRDEFDFQVVLGQSLGFAIEELGMGEIPGERRESRIAVGGFDIGDESAGLAVGSGAIPEDDVEGTAGVDDDAGGGGVGEWGKRGVKPTAVAQNGDGG